MTTETNIHRDSRLVKLRDLESKGYNPYPYCFKPTAYAADLQEKYRLATRSYNCCHSSVV